MAADPLVRQTIAGFEARFGRPPRWTVSAPGRVNIIGEHTDYNDGFVLPMAIDRCTVLAAAPSGTPRITLYSAANGESVTVNLEKPIVRDAPAWANYVRGVIAGFQKLGVPIPGMDIEIESSVPLGGGLSSSASLEVATATLLEEASGHPLEPVAKALLCQAAEHAFAGVPCGIMDQFAAVLARENHLLLLDCRSRATELVPMMDPAVSVLILNTLVKHSLVTSEYAQRRAQCEAAARALGVRSLRDATIPLLARFEAQLDPVLHRRARHVISEIDRTQAAVRAARAGDWASLGRLMYESHASLRDDYEVSCRELDLVVEAARAIGEQGGVLGCRMTGGGFGGCTVALVRSAAVAEVASRLTTEYTRQTRLEPVSFISRPAGGARVIA
ncbi:MAG TPA: galactokinase [Verrucomicrobiales bacterium]|nr:galactokinase [Verrucomicrobiales bacterium]